MFTSYAKCYAYCLACVVCIALAAGSTGPAIDLYRAGWPAYVVGLIPGFFFLLGAFFAFKAESHEPDPLPPALVKLST